MTSSMTSSMTSAVAAATSSAARARVRLQEQLDRVRLRERWHARERTAKQLLRRDARFGKHEWEVGLVEPERAEEPAELQCADARLVSLESPTKADEHLRRRWI
eukprot:3053480-Pleurochrysis_carterae.AAC.1